MGYGPTAPDTSNKYPHTLSRRAIGVEQRPAYRQQRFANAQSKRLTNAGRTIVGRKSEVDDVGPGRYRVRRSFASTLSSSNRLDVYAKDSLTITDSLVWVLSRRKRSNALDCALEMCRDKAERFRKTSGQQSTRSTQARRA